MKKAAIGITLDLHTDEEGFKYSVAAPWYALRVNYSQVVNELGCIPIFIALETDIEYILSNMDGIIIPGGDFHVPPYLYNAESQYENMRFAHERSIYEIKLVQKAKKHKIPLFGICHGMQILNVAFGGTLIQRIDTESHICTKSGSKLDNNILSHPIKIVENTALSNLVDQDQYVVNSYHSQAIDLIATSLRPSSFSQDGIIESVETIDNNQFLMGVQWHPEFMYSEIDNAIFRSFINAVTNYRAGKK